MAEIICQNYSQALVKQGLFYYLLTKSNKYDIVIR